MKMIKFEVRKKEIKILKKQSHVKKSIHILEDALTIYGWYLQEAAKGRKLLSADKDNTNLKMLNLPLNTDFDSIEDLKKMESVE